MEGSALVAEAAAENLRVLEADKGASANWALQFVYANRAWTKGAKSSQEGLMRPNSP